MRMTAIRFIGWSGTRFICAEDLRKRIHRGDIAAQKTGTPMLATTGGRPAPQKRTPVLTTGYGSHRGRIPRATENGTPMRPMSSEPSHQALNSR